MMETATLKAFASRARADLLREVGARATVVLADNSEARSESAAAVRELEQAIARDGRDAVVDRVAYTWFNRLVALRFMDANGYTPSGVVSPAGGGSGQPEVLADAKAGTFDSSVVPAATQQTITALLNGTRPSQDGQAEAYGLLLEAYCRSWNQTMPFMFEREGDATELLIPTALLSPDSVRDRAVKVLTDDVCRDVEVIGWLYQFYIADRKDEVFDGFKKNRKAGAAEIPAATQLFTPHWIVRYLVENSVGRLWLLNNPGSRLAEQMDYYVEPVDPETDYLTIASPEELTVIDPAVGSGHMLTYAFDLLHAIYTERGYDPADIPALILTHNLHGTEIDPRAGALAAFALTMKAAAKRKLFLKNPVQPNIRVLENIHLDPADLDHLWSHTPNGIDRADADHFWNAYRDADTLGSLVRPRAAHTALLAEALRRAEADDDLLHGDTHRRARAVVAHSEYLGRAYGVVVANPPYMGLKNMSATLSDFAARAYPDSKADLFAMFHERALDLTAPGGRFALVAMQSWMFLTSFEQLRERLAREASLMNAAHLGNMVMTITFGTVAAVWRRGASSTPHQATFHRVEMRDLDDGFPRPGVIAPSSAHYARPTELAELPGGILAYWLAPAAVSAFLRLPRLDSIASPRQGLATADNGRFVRQWWEVASGRIGFGLASRADARASGKRWFPYNKGGDWRRWYGNQEFVVNWHDDGHEIRNFGAETGRVRSRAQNTEYFFRPSVSWSKVSHTPAFRYFPPGFIFDVAGTSLFAADDDTSMELLAYANSGVARTFLGALSPTVNFEVGHIASLPVTQLGENVTDLVRRLIALSASDWDAWETSFAFTENELLRSASGTPSLAAALGQLRAAQEAAVAETSQLETRLDELFAAAYEIPLDEQPRGRTVSLWGNPRFRYGEDRTDAELADLGRRDAVADLVSYAVGCMFGRYSLDTPGLVLADQGSTLQQFLDKVPSPSFVPDADNVIPIVDGDWFEDDIVARFRQFLRAAFGEQHFEENLQFVRESLGVKDLRDYFVKSFYDDHVKRYKKRPIYWLFRSPKGSFSALVYLHRYTPSTVSTVLTGYLREFIGKLEANLDHQGRVAAGLGSASPRDIAAAVKEADRLRKVLVELRDYERDILFPLAGQQIHLDLDDGVLVNYQKLGTALKDIGLKKGGGE